MHAHLINPSATQATEASRDVSKSHCEQFKTFKLADPLVDALTFSFLSFYPIILVFQKSRDTHATLDNMTSYKYHDVTKDTPGSVE